MIESKKVDDYVAKNLEIAKKDIISRILNKIIKDHQLGANEMIAEYVTIYSWVINNLNETTADQLEQLVRLELLKKENQDKLPNSQLGSYLFLSKVVEEKLNASILEYLQQKKGIKSVADQIRFDINRV